MRAHTCGWCSVGVPEVYVGACARVVMVGVVGALNEPRLRVCYVLSDSTQIFSKYGLGIKPPLGHYGTMLN
jgi:hypothetical protein